MKTTTLGKVMSLFLLTLAGTSFGQVDYLSNPSTTITYKSYPDENGYIRCHTMEMDSIRRANNPGMPTLEADEQWLQSKIAEYKANNESKGTQAVVLTIPIVFHVITSGSGATNVSAARVQAQLDQLNIDFRGLAGSTHPDNADVEIQFCLAKVDPSGATMSEYGINRITAYGAGPHNSSTIDNTIKPATIWDTDDYFNVWVANLSGGLLGWAQFPQSSGLTGLSGPYTASTDGVVVLHTSLGSNASPGSGAPYNRGRTLTHEAGHWFGLRHIWGDASCGNDFCADTPQSSTANGGCPTQTTCDGIQDMVENYMDYTNDACMDIFTDDQKTRIRTVMTNSPRRNTLGTSTKCSLASVGEISAANFSVYPNPSNGTFNVTLANSMDRAELVVLDLMGRVVMDSDFSNGTATIDLSAFANGNYLVRVSAGGTSEVRKIELKK